MLGIDMKPRAVDILITPDEVAVTVSYELLRSLDRREIVLDMIAAAMSLSLTYDVPLSVNEEEEYRD